MKGRTAVGRLARRLLPGPGDGDLNLSRSNRVDKCGCILINIIEL